jgi:hypothetical protein
LNLRLNLREVTSACPSMPNGNDNGTTSPSAQITAKLE